MTPHHSLCWKDKKPFSRLPPPRESTSIENCMPGCLKAYTVSLANQIQFLVDRNNGEVCSTDIWGKWWATEGQIEFQASILAILASACLLTLGHNTITAHWFTYTEMTVSTTVLVVPRYFLQNRRKIFVTGRHCHIHGLSCLWEDLHALNIRSVNQKRVFPTQNVCWAKCGLRGLRQWERNTLGPCSLT